AASSRCFATPGAPDSPRLPTTGFFPVGPTCCVLLLHPHPPLHRRHNLRRTHGMRRLVIAPDAPRSRAVALEHRDVASRAHDADTGFGEPVAPFTVISRRRHADAGRLTVRGHARIESELR